ncbi:MerR family transcriptional regulator [uncultured Tenacibaculum sp.]|uniref:MerR family transcriptional regulator n=1 Tax=uncultured Tenacibaculum sp. TaxID=174713 RepID=UPI002618542D|nr:MerR family transcriptional regulator [uncultured Tenacibaculum sp.]
MYIDLPKKRYYKIGEVAKAFEVNTSLIRFWEGEFDIIKPKKNAKGNRLFTPEDIENFKLIYNLVKERGFTLDGAKQKLKQNPAKIVQNQEIINRLEAVKAELIKIKNQIE